MEKKEYEDLVIDAISGVKHQSSSLDRITERNSEKKKLPAALLSRKRFNKSTRLLVLVYTAGENGEDIVDDEVLDGVSEGHVARKEEFPFGMTEGEVSVDKVIGIDNIDELANVKTRCRYVESRREQRNRGKVKCLLLNS